MTHPHEDLLRRGYAAFAEGDMDTLEELFTDDIAWHIPGDTPVSGDYEGRKAVFGFFGELAERTGGTFRLEIHDVLANDEHAVALVRPYAERNGRQLDGPPVAHVWHVEDGQVAEFWEHPHDQARIEKFWAESEIR